MQSVERAGELEVPVNGNPEIRKAVDIPDKVSWKEAREKAWRKHETETHDIKVRGLEEVLEKTARNAIAEGLAVEVVSKITGLDVETVAGLRG